MVALKITLSCLVCFGIIAYFRMDQGYLFLIPIFFGPLSLPLRAQQTCWETALGDVIGALIFIPLVQLIDHWWLYLVINVLLLVVILLIGFKSRFLFTALFMVVTGAVIFDMAQSGPSQAISYGIEWARDAVIGALVYFIVDFVFFPRFAVFQLEKILREAPIRSFPLEEAQKLFQVSKYRIFKKRHAEFLETKIGIFGALQFYQKRAENHLDALRDHAEVYLEASPRYRRFAEQIESYAKAIQQSPDGKNLGQLGQTELLGLENYLDSLLKTLSKPNELEILERGYALKKHMENMIRVVSIYKERKIPDPAPLKLSFSSPMKTAVLAASILCFVVWIVTFLALPGGMQPVFSAFAAVSQPNIGKLSKQLLDRFLGVLFGGGASMIILMTLGEITHLWMLIFLFGLFMGFFSYLSLSRPQWSYIFLQACAAVVMLSTYDTLILVPTIEVIGQRFFGIAIGFVIGFVLMALFGLESAIALFELKLRSYLAAAGKIIFKTGAVVPADYSQLQFLLLELKTLLSHSEFELGSSKDAYRLFKQQVFLLERVGYNLETLLGLKIHAQLDFNQHQTLWLRENLQSWLLELQEILKNWPTESTELNSCVLQLERLENLNQMVITCLHSAFKEQRLIELTESEKTDIFSFSQIVRGLSEGLRDLLLLREKV